jgi:hypothetical protein
MPAPVYVHVTVEPDCEQADGNVARADPTNTTPHNTAKPAAAANNTPTRPRAPARNKPNPRAPPENIADHPILNRPAASGRLTNTPTLPHPTALVKQPTHPTQRRKSRRLNTDAMIEHQR